MRALKINLGRLLAPYAGAFDAPGVGALALTSDGWRLAVGLGPRVAVFDTSDGRCVAEHLAAAEGWVVRDLRFGRSGRYLLTNSWEMACDGSESLCVFETGGPTPRLTIVPRRSNALDGNIKLWAFNPEGSLLAAATTGAACVWELSTGRPLADVEGLLWHMAVDEDGLPRSGLGSARAALSPNGGTVALWKVAPSNKALIDYGDHLVLGDVHEGGHTRVDLRDTQCFTTQASRPGRHRLAFSDGGDLLVGAMRVDQSDASFVVSFAHALREQQTHLLMTPQGLPLEPFDIEGNTPSVLWSDAHHARRQITLLRQDLKTGGHEVTVVPSEGGERVVAVALSANGSVIARAIDNEVFVLRAT